jgi:hypothetical protein
MATYFVKNGGNDSLNGISDGNAWATIAKVNAQSLSPGDSIFFNKGNTWNEKLLMPSSGTLGNNIVFDAYGTGAKPIFDVSVRKTDFVLDSGSIYKRTANGPVGNFPRQMFQDGVRLIKAVSKVAMVQGSWFADATFIYVWTTGSTNPNVENVEQPVFPNAIDFNGKSFITVNNIAGKRSANGVFDFRELPCHDITMNNCEASQSGFRGYDGGGIYGVTTKYNLTFNYCLAYDTCSEGFWMGVGHDLSILNCEVYDGHKDAAKGYTNVDVGGIIIGNEAPNCLLSGTYIHDIYDGGLAYIEWESGAAFQPKNVTIEHNHFVDNIPHVSVGTCVGLNGDSTCVLRYNLIEVKASSNGAHPSNGVASNAGTGGGAAGCKVYNNTIIQSISGKWCIAMDNVSWTDNQNNICRNTASTAIVTEGTNATTSIYKNNIYYGTGGTHGFFTHGSNSYTTLSTWAADSGDTGSIVGDPLFANESLFDYRIKTGSPAIGHGRNLGPPNNIGFDNNIPSMTAFLDQSIHPFWTIGAFVFNDVYNGPGSFQSIGDAYVWGGGDDF